MTSPNAGDSTDLSSGSQQTAELSAGATRQTPNSQELSSASSYANLNYLFGIQNTTMDAPKPNRNRRKPAQGSEHVKHRRTRSGCYTCRSRRVKCDEAHPICERCKKGGRECIYPELPTSSKSAGSGSSRARKAKTRESTDSSSDENDEGCESERLEAIPDEDESLEKVANTRKVSEVRTRRSSFSQPSTGPQGILRQDSETPSLVQDKAASPTPSTEGSTGYATYRDAKKASFSSAGSDGLRSDWSHLPMDLQFYLTYFFENVTHYHYSLKCSSGGFLRTSFLDAALRNDALLYGIVGFSAFHRTLHNPEGKIQDFLQYYNKAVSLLLHSLKTGERRSNSTILAILQLATIEEFLGDWINLLGHQKAAYEILTELYTPQTVSETELTRVMLSWYSRFDVFAGLMGGFETVLSREWFECSCNFFKERSQIDPENLDWKVETAVAQHRLLAMDMSLLFAKQGKGEISLEHFFRENELITQRIVEWKSKMDPALQDKRHMVTDFTGAPPLDPADIVNPYMPGTLYNSRLFVMNVVITDWNSLDLMHKMQTALVLKTNPSEELKAQAFRTCQLFEAVELWPGSPPGAMLACQASLGIAAIFLPRDERCGMWVRRKLANIECNGYIYPYTFRNKMADFFRDRSCMHWWLPHDEGYPPIIRTIRKFVEERTSPAKNVITKDLQDMKAIFSSLKLSDDDGSDVLSKKGKGKGAGIGVAVATNQDPFPDMSGATGEVNGYGLHFEAGSGFWVGNQPGGGF